MNELELIIDLHKNAHRQGPGSPESTLKALEFINIPDSDKIRIADIGCGSGAQTKVLAENTRAQITAVDLFPEFLHNLEKRAKKHQFHHRIAIQEHSMDDLPFAEEEFDVIWSEGAVYNMGFEKGISYWKQFLKTGGYLAVSEISWLTDSRPQEIETYWNRAYPEMATVPEKLSILFKYGYSLVAHFILSESCWLDHYYLPLEARFPAFLIAHSGNNLAAQIVEQEQYEIEIYRKYKAYYSYGFYIAKKL